MGSRSPGHARRREDLGEECWRQDNVPKDVGLGGERSALVEHLLEELGADVDGSETEARGQSNETREGSRERQTWYTVSKCSLMEDSET